MTEEENQSERQVNLLRSHRKSIVADLDVQDVIPELLKNLIFLHDDKQRVDLEKTLEDKANILLNILERKAVIHKNRDALPVFINSLKLRYSWLYAKLAEDVPDFKVPALAKTEKEKVRNASAWSIQQKSKNRLEAGGVPCLPVFSVERKDLIQTIRQELSSLKRNQYLVLNGMAGCGKSVLATQACHSVASTTDVSNLFQDGIFWLSIGKECSEAKDAILAKMRILCDKVEESRAPSSLEHGAELLRSAFIKRSNAILILDDVWRPEVIRAFDVGCRTIVTTRDVSVMDVVQGRIKCVKVSDGFTEHESLKLFQQAVGNDKELPETARSIHFECKGSPMVVSLISALLQDHASSDEGRWSYYLDALSKRKYSKMRRNREYEHESIVDAIALSVESLSENTRNYYSDFALFQDDVGIPCPVLMVLWDLGKYEVEDLMKELVRKSLAADEYDPVRKWNIYSVHDLQLDYLKYQLYSENGAERKLHSKLIDKYLMVSEYQFHKLPDDGYIHFHLAYHLYKSDRQEDFARAYLNLLFIGEKIRITGPADLLVDLRKYQDFIFGNDFDERSAYIDQLKTFTQLVGHRLYGQTDDIVQLALLTPKLNKIYKQARSLANCTPHRLYLEWKNASATDWKNPESTVLCSDNIRCVKFIGNEGKHFLAALNNGCIELCDLDSSTVCHRFAGHRGAVQSIDVFQFENNTLVDSGRGELTFLSASEDKTCKLWDLKLVFGNIELKTSETSLGSSPSPKLRPDNWTFDKLRDDSFLTFEFHTAPLTYAEFSRDGSKIVSTSINEVMVWNPKNGQVFSKISLYFPSAESVAFQTCQFTYEDSRICLPYLISSAENQLVLFSMDRPSLFTSVEGHHMRIVAILLLSSSAFCTVSENEIGLWKMVQGKTPPRSRSLSPRKSYPFTSSNGGTSISKTQSDALTMSPASEYEIELLRPSGSKNLLNVVNDVGEDATGRKSPTLSSDCYSPATVSAVLDTGTDFVKIWRDEVLPRKSSGLFQCAAVSQDDLLACGTSERKIILWQLEERRFLGEFSSHNGWLRSLDFSAVDRRTLLSGSEDHTVMVWDVEEEQRGKKEPHKQMFFSSVYILTPELLNPGFFLSIFATDINTVQVFRDSKLLLNSVVFPVPISAVVLSTCGSNGIVGTKDGRILRLKDLRVHIRMSLRKTMAESNLGTEAGFDLIGFMEGTVTFLKFDSSGLYLVAGSASGTAMIFKGFQFHRSIKSSCGCITNCHFLFDNFLAIISLEETIAMIQNIETGHELKGYQSSEIKGVTCSIKKIDSSAIVIGTSEQGVIVCTIEENRGIIETAIINCGQNTAVASLAFSGDGFLLAVGHENGLITIWSLNGGIFMEEQDLLLHKARVRFLLFSPMFVGDGRWLVSCGDRLAFWSLSKPDDRIRKPSFMEERRRRRSGESRPSSRLSLQLSDGVKIGRQGKRELLQSFWFHGVLAEMFVSNPCFSEFITVDDTGVLYFVEIFNLVNQSNYHIP